LVSFEPTFIYLLGTRNFNASSAAVTGITHTNYNAFQTSVAVLHTLGPWLFGGKFAYSSGDDANDNLNNTQFGNRSDVNGFRTLGNDGSHYFGEWFEILGKSDVDGNSIQFPCRLSCSISARNASLLAVNSAIWRCSAATQGHQVLSTLDSTLGGDRAQSWDAI